MTGADSTDRLLDLLRDPAAARIVVVGDVMLDGYLHGVVERISPEAPIPILQVSHVEERIGGAGSVTMMLAALGVDVRLISVVGSDMPGGRVREILRSLGVDDGQVYTDAGRPTTFKQRLLGGTQSRQPYQMVRVDHECCRPLEQEIQKRLFDAACRSLDDADVLLISDYEKGVCGDELTAQLIREARQRGIPVLADPARGVDFTRYAGCRCITPNRSETIEAVGAPVGSVAEGLAAAQSLVRSARVDAVTVTLDRDGIALADRNGTTDHFPTRPIQVCDITGAGDMVLGMLGLATALGASLAEAVELANLAAGIEIQKQGVSPVSRAELIAELQRARQQSVEPTDETNAPSEKIVPVEQFLRQIEPLRRAGRKIVMTNGCFDLLHPGHVALLQAARAEGDLLVVGLNSDQSVQSLKGPTRPIVDEASRAAMLAAIGCVDYVVLFDTESVLPLVQQIVPDVLVKASQYEEEQIVGHQVVRQAGGRIVRVPMTQQFSTSDLIRKIRDEDQASKSRVA